MIEHKKVLPPSNSQEMVADFIKNPVLGEAIREASAMLLDSIDNDYFTEKISLSERELVKMIKENFAERDPAMEVRLYKTEHLIYAIIKAFEKEGIISLIKQKTQEDQIKERAQKIWTDYRRKKKI